MQINLKLSKYPFLYICKNIIQITQILDSQKVPGALVHRIEPLEIVPRPPNVLTRLYPEEQAAEQTAKSGTKSFLRSSPRLDPLDQVAGQHIHKCTERS